MTVLTVITREEGAGAVARLGYRVARALEEKLVVLCLEVGDPPGDSSDGPASIVPGEEIPDGAIAGVAGVCGAFDRPPGAEELSAEASTGGETGTRSVPEPEVEVRWLKTRRRLGAVLEQVQELDAGFLVAAKHRPRSKKVPLARKLFTATPCHMLLARLGDGADDRPSAGGRVLVPTAGGPHAAVALRLAERLASAEGGKVVPLYVASKAGELAGEVGERILQRAIDEADLEASDYVEPRVELADDRFEAIARVAGEGFDLLLIGDSDAGSLRRQLFGTVPEHLLTGDRGLQVAVVRREWKLLHRLRRRLGRWLDLTIPQMARAERIALYDKLHSGSKWNFDFMMLISLSTAIAALGLLQDSAAVVIGAMLVAPLMTPILGAGLGLVQGNWPLLKTAARAIVSGYMMALLIGLATGLIFPIRQLTPQLEARGGPTLLDLGVAFLSGLAAAFCLARPGLLAALPGVAIAAALVPPIATTGVCLALAETATARGSAILFATNVVAIILGAAVSLYASGVRGRRGAGSHQKWVTYAFLGLLLGTVTLAFPLGAGLRSQLIGGFRVPAELEAQLKARVEAHAGTRLVDVVPHRGGPERILDVEIASPGPLPPELPPELAAVAREALGDDLKVRVGTRLRVDVE